MRTLRAELYGLAAASGGVDAAAAEVGIDEELYQRAMERDAALSKLEQDEIDTAFAEFKDDADDAALDFMAAAEGFMFEFSDRQLEVVLAMAQSDTGRFVNLINDYAEDYDIDDTDFWEWWDKFYGES